MLSSFQVECNSLQTTVSERKQTVELRVNKITEFEFILISVIQVSSVYGVNETAEIFYVLVIYVGNTESFVLSVTSVCDIQSFVVIRYVNVKGPSVDFQRSVSNCSPLTCFATISL